MRTLFVNCVCVATLVFEGVAGAAAEDEATCANELTACDEAGVEASSLLQTSMRDRSLELAQLDAQRFPDFAGKIGDLTKGVPGLGGVADIADKAQSAMKEGEMMTLKLLMEAINNTLKLLETEVDAYERIVEETANETASGIASMLARALNVPEDSIPTSAKYEMQANITLAKAISLWSTVDTSGQKGANVLAKGLEKAGYADAAAVLNKSVSKAIKKGSTLEDSLRYFQSLLAKSEKHGESVQLLQFHVFGMEFGHTDLAAKLSGTLHKARKQIQTFPEAFGLAFTALHEKVDKMAKKTFSDEQVKEIDTACESASQEASVLAQKITNTTLKMVDSLDRGVQATRSPTRSAAASSMPSLISMILAAMMMFSSTS